MSRLQNIILPRNWLFGRFASINNNLKNSLMVNRDNLTIEEQLALREASKLITDVIKGKKEGSRVLKTNYQNSTRV